MTRLNSLLFVPGHRADRFGKALGAGADAVIVDLEDAVAPADKEAARAALAQWLAAEQPVLVRINAAGTPWFADDLRLLSGPGIAGVVLPKAERLEDLATVRAAAAGRPLFPLIESAAGYEARRAVAAAPGVARVLFGTIDFQADMGMRCTEDDLLPFRVELVLASRLAGIAPPVDGVCPALDDEDRLARESRRACALGFGGKLCIHPRQVAVVNRSFSPTAEEADWAQRVIAADAAAGGAAVAVDGRMVDRPVVLRAQAILRDLRA